LSLQHKDQSTKRRAKSDPKGSNAPEVPLKGHAGGHFLRSAPKKTLCGKKYATVLTYWVWGSNGLVVFFLGGGFGALVVVVLFFVQVLKFCGSGTGSM